MAGYFCAYIFILVLSARTSLAKGCSQTCFENGSLDPNTIDDTSLFLWRAYHSSVVLGDYLYIDGGERAYTPNGTATTTPDLYTYSIDLSVQWTNQNVSLNRIDKGRTPRVLNSANIWKNPDNDIFYSYNGAMSWISSDVGIRQNELWQFKPSGNSGTWSNLGLTAAATANFTSLVRVTRAASAFGNGVGYSLGGVQNWRTANTAPFDEDSKGNTAIQIPVPGLVTYNMVTGMWSNITNGKFPSTGSFTYGQLQYVPGFGGGGLLIPLGGQTSSAVNYESGRTTLDDFATISLYDIASGTWHTQRTSGDRPPGRFLFCAVDVQGDDDTFEIFIFGGSSFPAQQGDVALDAVYVLSLPAFHWEKSTYQATQARSLHTCNVLGEGNRQMAVIGGYDHTVANVDIWHDPWPQGIAIFDLSDMGWKEGYNPSAAKYQTPRGIKDWYAQNGRFPKEWDEPFVQRLFNATASTNSTEPSGAENLAKNVEQRNNAGAIAGGIAGGLAVISLTAILVWYFVCRRRRQNKDAKPTIHSDPFVKPELHADAVAIPELHQEPVVRAFSQSHELVPSPNGQPLEISSRQKYELP